jgi:hypothetical protein
MKHFGNTETLPRCRGSPLAPTHAPLHTLTHPHTPSNTLTPLDTHPCTPLAPPSEQVPVYYVMFTVCTIAISNILYKDFRYEDRR